MRKLKTDIFENEPKDMVEKTRRIICILKSAEDFPNDLSNYLATYSLDEITDYTNVITKESDEDKLKFVKKLSKFWLGVSLFANGVNNSNNFNQSVLNIKSSFAELITATEKTVLNKDVNIFPFIENLSNTYYSNKDISLLLNDYKLFFEAITETFSFIEY